jgi:MIP family channel proteins
MRTARPAAYAAELVGTFLLVLFIGLILASNSPGGLGATDFAVVGLLHAFLLTMLIATLGALSGAHFNPAMTIALATVRKVSWSTVPGYIAAQVVGAVVAALVVKLALTAPADATSYGATSVNEIFLAGDGAAALAEMIGTFALMWAIMGTAVNPRAERASGPLVIGSTLGLAVMAIGPLTGAGLNPARAFGPALVGDAFGGAGTFVLVYLAAPVAGALLAALGYRALTAEREAVTAHLRRQIDEIDRPATAVD